MRIELEQRSPEWHEFRKGKIGSSAAATIMDCNPFQTKEELWNEMKGAALPRYESEAMRRGTTLEPDALECGRVISYRRFLNLASSNLPPIPN